ncbi:hypothetical protein [Pseudonocardia phyllosphaerae]|uniref:hypothetical protein n=1 Tax=Pseudonocardia phyllosphaerae TaxID=3390502 RepID=UPI003979CDD3
MSERYYNVTLRHRNGTLHATTISGTSEDSIRDVLAGAGCETVSIAPVVADAPYSTQCAHDCGYMVSGTADDQDAALDDHEKRCNG